MPVVKFTPATPAVQTTPSSRVTKFTPAAVTPEPDQVTPEAETPYATDENAAQDRTWLDSALDTLKGAWNVVNPVTAVQGAIQASAHPINTVRGIGRAQGELAYKAKAAFDKGDYVAGVRHSIEYLLPLIGPQLAQAGDKAEQGKVAEAVGESIGIGAMLGAPKLTPRSVSLPAVARNINAAERAAVDFGIREGIPVDIATATGNPVARGAQKLAEHTSLAGSFVGRRAVRNQAAAMSDLGDTLATRAHPTAMVPETAGNAVVEGVERTISGLKKEADTAYDAFRTVAQDPKHTRNVQVGTRQVTMPGPNGQPVLTTVPIMKDVALPVDVRAIKAVLKPIYADMSQWMEPARRNASAGFQAIKSILEGDDYLPAATAERGLGGLKELAREAKSADLRDVNQGLGASAAKRLQAAIDSTVGREAGAAALKDLQAARAAHASKMRAGDVLGKLRDEPVQVFNQATWANDSGIERLRDIGKLAPGELPKVGRAYLENILNDMRSEGGMNHAQRAYSTWQKLGPETKKLLFNPSLIGDLDNFFLLAKKMAENPNPSGTAYVGGLAAHAFMFKEPLSFATYEISGYGLARMLRSPAAAKALTTSMTVNLGNKAKAAAAAAAVLRFAGDDAVPVKGPLVIPGVADRGGR